MQMWRLLSNKLAEQRKRQNPAFLLHEELINSCQEVLHSVSATLHRSYLPLTLGLLFPNVIKINCICSTTNLACSSNCSRAALLCESHVASNVSASVLLVALASCVFASFSSSSYISIDSRRSLATIASPFSAPILFSTGAESLSHHDISLPEPLIFGLRGRRMARKGASRDGTSRMHDW